MTISFFKDTYDKVPHDVDVEAVFSGIKNGRWKKEILELRESKNEKLKSLLPAATFSGTFIEKRKSSNLSQYSGLVTIDIDDKREAKIKKLKKMLSEDPFIFAAFISPRGGIKVLVRVDSGAEHHKTHAYLQIKEWIENNYDVEVDKSGSDTSRLCYVSYDPDLHYNPNSQMYTIDTTAVYETKVPVAPTSINFGNGERETDINVIFSLCQSWVHKRGLHYGKGGRNNYIHQIANLLNEAGLSEDQIIYAITSNHSISAKMGKELRDTVSGVCKRKSGKCGTMIINKSNKTKDLVGGE